LTRRSGRLPSEASSERRHCGRAGFRPTATLGVTAVMSDTGDRIKSGELLAAPSIASADKSRWTSQVEWGSGTSRALVETDFIFRRPRNRNLTSFLIAAFWIRRSLVSSGFLSIGVVSSWLLCLFAASHATAAAEMLDSVPSDKSVQDRLSAIWQSKASSIITFRCQARLYMVSFPPGKGPTQENVRELFEKCNPEESWARDVKASLSRFDGAKFGYWGKVVKCFRDSVKLRNDYCEESQDVIWIFDGRHALKHSLGGKEVSVHDGRSMLYYYSENDFGFFPKKPLPGKAVVTDRGNSQVELKSGFYDIIANRENGFATSVQYYNPMNTDVLVDETRRAFPFDNDGLFARVTGNFQYDQGHATRMTFLIADHIEINSELSPSTFEVNIDAGDNLVDYRQDPQKPTITKATKSSKNALLFADTIAPSQTVVPKLVVSEQSNRPYFLGAAIMVSVLAMIVLWKRRTKHAPV
jgi:hypothetical protein